ncbi:hypothetical protein QFC19_002936 [Naganishia cerealis]|uniref:Uncharacterized protein n=1 Tax=Naganishia cerealis TaxID=610337 RepID=A0ACC2W891_9TREE|nr:hypothetical protein QFC19_002936 [Naganishia cerealis]
MKLLSALTLAVVSSTLVDAKQTVEAQRTSETPDNKYRESSFSSFEKAQSGEAFDRSTDARDGFVRLTDDNFDELVVYERLDLTHDKVTEDERVWFFLVHGPPKDPASFVFWEAINNASIINQHPANHIKGLKWGRIDFLTELELTTRWLIFKPPMLVFATHRGTELRFVNARQMAANGTIIHRFLKEEMWRNLPVWQSRYGPGGDRAWMLTVYIKVNQLFTRLTDRIPSWLLVVISGIITQSMLTFMHRGSGPKDTKNIGEEKAQVAIDGPVADSSISSSEKTSTVKHKAVPKARKETKKGK